MQKITADQIRKLKESTGAPVMRVKQVLEQEKGNESKAEAILKKEGFEKMAKRTDRATSEGKVFAYTHHTGKVVAVVELMCETDFVARNELFEALGKDLAMQAASMGEKDLEKQEFIKDPKKTMGELVKEVVVKTGENIRIGKVLRVELGK